MSGTDGTTPGEDDSGARGAPGAKPVEESFASQEARDLAQRRDAEIRKAADDANKARELRRAGLYAENDPLWREDFPLTSGGEEYVQRRQFTRYLLATSAAFAVGTVGAAAWANLQSANRGEPARIIELSKMANGSEFLFAYPTEKDPALLIRLPNGELRAFSQKCTHLGCVVYYQPERERVFCPCHHGVFEPSTGDPIAGPPERALQKIDIEIRDGVIWAKGVQV